MTQRINNTSFRYAAVASALFLSFGETGGVFGGVPDAEAMTGSIDLGVLIAVRTSAAGMGGVALVYAGRRSYNCSVVMTQGSNRLLFHCAAVASALFLAFGGAGGVHGNGPCAKGMAGSGNFGVLVAVAASAGMGGVALIYAGRRSDSCGVGVGDHRNRSGFSGETDGTGLGVDAFGGAGRR